MRKPLSTCSGSTTNLRPAWVPLCDDFTLLNPRECPDEVEVSPVAVPSPPVCPTFPAYSKYAKEHKVELLFTTDGGAKRYELPDKSLSWDICARQSVDTKDLKNEYYNGCVPEWLYWLKQELPLCITTEVAAGSGIHYIGCETPGNSYIRISTKQVESCIVIVLAYHIDIPTIGRLD